MTKENTVELLTMLRLAYPRFYANITKQDAQATLELWYSMFKEEDNDVVKAATKTLISSLEFPPTIADVKKEIDKLVNAATDKPTAIDEWNAIRKAIGNSIYNSAEMFETLSPIAKQYVGTPNQLKQWAMATDFNPDVAKGQFLKQYSVLEEREKYKAILDEKALVQRITTQNNKLLGGAESV